MSWPSGDQASAYDQPGDSVWLKIGLWPYDFVTTRDIPELDKVIIAGGGECAAIWCRLEGAEAHSPRAP